MKLFYSLSQYPGKVGQTFYTHFFKKYNIEATYTPYGVTPTDFQKLFDDIKSIASGINISMPYKQTIIKHLDIATLDVQNYNTCNTVHLQGSKIVGYNTDLCGVIAAVANIDYQDKIIILGNGSIGRMFYKYMQSIGYSRVSMISRSLQNYHERHNSCDVLINCTSLGTVNSDSPIDNLHDHTRYVVDVSLKPRSLYDQSLAKGVEYFSGLSFYKHQFIKQFFLHTGIKISINETDETVLKND